MEPMTFGAHQTEETTGSTVTSAETLSQSTPSLDFLLLLAMHKRLIMLCFAISLALGCMVAFLLKPTFTAVATIMPPQAPQSSLSSLMGQLGAISSLSGAPNLLKNPADLYVGLLQSRTIADRAIQQFHLQQHWHAKTRFAAEKDLDSHAQFESAKSGLIQISVSEHDPQLASDLANYFVDALYNMNSSLAMTEAAQRRIFFERQINEERAALTEAEDDLKKTQQQTGLLALNGQIELAIRNIAEMRAQISAHEVELESLRTYATDENPDVQRVQEQLRTLRSQLATMESSQKNAGPGNTEIATREMPSGSLEYARKLREVKYHDTLFDLLSRQYEAARIDEAKSAPLIQVVDRALPPDQKSGPPRVLIIGGMAIVGLLTGCGSSFLIGSINQATKRPDVANKLALLRSQLPACLLRLTGAKRESSDMSFR